MEHNRGNKEDGEIKVWRGEREGESKERERERE